MKKKNLNKVLYELCCIPFPDLQNKLQNILHYDIVSINDNLANITLVESWNNFEENNLREE